jgi:hypothetical protein
MADAGLVPQHAEPTPEAARLAAAPYFSCTTALMSSVLMKFSFSPANRDNVLRGDHVVSGAAFGIQKAKKILESIGIRAIPEESALPTNGDEFLISEFVQVMGKRGVGYFEFRLDVSDYHTLWFGRHQKLHDA